MRGGFFLSRVSVTTSSTAIQLDHVSKRYGSKAIVHDMTFSVEAG